MPPTPTLCSPGPSPAPNPFPAARGPATPPPVFELAMPLAQSSPLCSESLGPGGGDGSGYASDRDCSANLELAAAAAAAAGAATARRASQLVPEQARRGPPSGANTALGDGVSPPAAEGVQCPPVKLVRPHTNQLQRTYTCGHIPQSSRCIMI